MVKYSLDGVVGFNDPTHSYFNVETGESLQSTTNKIGEFKIPFDSERMSGFVAKKRGISPEEVLSEWAENSSKACEMGTAIHQFLEDWCKGEKSEKGEHEKFDVAEQFALEYLDTGRLIPELVEPIVYDLEAGLAGQVDLICKSKAGKRFILDYKTNKEIKFEGYRGAMMKAPFDHMPDCSFSHYTIQLNVYRKMLGLPVDGLYIVWVDTHDFYLMEVPIINIPFL